MNQFYFSIVIPTYNRPQVLAKTLHFLEQQETNIPFEVIVVDDCSKIPLPDLGFGRGKRLNWKLLGNEKNLGRAATRNIGIREAKGEYILMIDDDIWAVPGLLEAHYEAQKKINGGIVVGAVPPAQKVNNSVWNRYLKKRIERIHRRLQEPKLDYGLFLTGNVSILARLLKDFGGFDENFKDYSFEDTDLGYRLYKAGVKFFYAPEAKGYHMFDENLESICRKAYQMGRSAYLFKKLHPDRARDIQYHSIVINRWQKGEIFKNVIKILLYNKPAMILLKNITKIASILRMGIIVFYILKWVELQNMAEGNKKISDSKKFSNVI